MSRDVPMTPRHLDTPVPAAEGHSTGVPSFTEGEALLLCDAFNGGMFEHDGMYVQYAKNPIFRWTVEDAIRLDGLDLKWGVDGDALCRRLGAMAPAEVSSTLEAIRRFWMPGAAVRPNSTLREAVRLAGLCGGGM